MTEPAPSPALARGGRSRLVASLVLLVAVLVGGTAGVAFDRLVLLPARFGPPPFGPGAPPGPRHERAARERFARELGLSDEQRVRIDSLMERQIREIRAARTTVQPRLDSIIGETRRAIDSILTPDQRAKAEEMARRRPRRPPLDGPMPGGPPRDEDRRPPPR